MKRLFVRTHNQFDVLSRYSRLLTWRRILPLDNVRTSIFMIFIDDHFIIDSFSVPVFSQHCRESTVARAKAARLHSIWFSSEYSQAQRQYLIIYHQKETFLVYFFIYFLYWIFRFFFFWFTLRQFINYACVIQLFTN